ncbi:MAG: NAD+ synthase, partial [Planctomycetota bacterium]
SIPQLPTPPGEAPGKADRIGGAWRRARTERADLLVVPELAVVGYPPRDLLLRPSLIERARDAVERLAAEFREGPPAVVGTVVPNPHPIGRPLHNAAVFLRAGHVERVYAKQVLPTYDVFDEHRYFEPGLETVVVEVGGRRLGLLICEDLWVKGLVRGRRLYDADPPAAAVARGVDGVVAIAASPYHQGKDRHRRDLFAAEAARMGVPLVVAQQVGANDDVLFDGCSRVFDAEGRCLGRLAAFEEDFRVVDLDARGEAIEEVPRDAGSKAQELRRALRMGIRGYFRKTGFERALIGLSGGVDSGVVACLAADALGPGNVRGVGMPGPYSASISLEDAGAQAAILGIDFTAIPIRRPYEAFLDVLEPLFEGRPFDVTEENLQARTRGTILMALSNKLGALVLATGNKSEMAVGYATLYGDMNGGLAVLADVWKTRVYDLARLYLAEGTIPRRTVERPPSAELRPHQTDQDTLPPYPVLDRILKRRIEEGADLDTIVADGEDPAVVERVLRMMEASEYKRRQMAPGLKVTPTAFGVGWRMPIARPLDLRGERVPD